MYDLILDGLYRLNSRDTDSEKAQYLQSLKQAAIRLRKSYDPSGGSYVNVDYRDKKIQSAYMLRYFPQYSQIIRIVLDKIKNNGISLPFNQESVSACFFGSGPLPEIYGFMQFLRPTFKNAKEIAAYAFDIISDEWTYSRYITEIFLIPSLWENHQFELVNNNFDLSQVNSISEFTPIIGSSELIVFQNCLNEISQNVYPNVIKNFASIVKAMKPGSLLIIIDLSSYPAALDLISQLEASTKAENSTEILISLSKGQSIYDAVNFLNMLPSIIKENLLTGENGLIPRRYIKYHCLAVRKS